MKTLFVLLVLLLNTQAFANELCQKAHIEKFLVDTTYSGTSTDDLCLEAVEKIPAAAKLIFEKITELNMRVIKSLGLNPANPFLGELNFEIKVSKQGPIDDSYNKDDIKVVLGADKNDYFAPISSFIYIHELGHWYLTRYLTQTLPDSPSLGNVQTFQEFFADALVVAVLGSFDTSEIKLPLCLRQIRNLGPDITYRKPINFFDYANFFRKSTACCSSIRSSGEETVLTESICTDTDEMRKFFYPDAIPAGSTLPLDQNISSVYSLPDGIDSTLEPHVASTPMNSFLLELSTRLNIPLMDLLLPALRKALDLKTVYRCDLKEIMDLGRDLGTSVTTPDVAIEEVFDLIKKSLPDQKVFTELETKYSMATAKTILRHDITYLLKFSLQNEIPERVKAAWQNNNPWLRSWECLDQTNGSFKPECVLNVQCDVQAN